MPFIKPSSLNEQAFDFVIIGGGTAGCVLANRLTSDGKYTVLVLEAGTQTPAEVLESRVPLLNSHLKNTQVDWKHKSIPQPHLDNRTIQVPSGKILGGNSSFNACVFHRCTPSDFDAWNTIGWTYEELKPYFCKAESFHDRNKKSIHGTTGPIHATQKIPGPIGKYFTEACKNKGLVEYYDITDVPCQIGVTNLQASMYKGQRSSTFTCYITKEVQDRGNLIISPGCHVQKIIFDRKRAEKVEYKDQNGNILTVNAKREVILSAGALLSPFLLLKSGVGPKDELSRNGIDTIVDLPGVGKNLQNHWRLPLVHETKKAEMSIHRGLFENIDELTKKCEQEKNCPYTGLWADSVAYSKIPDAPDNSSHGKNTPQIEIFAGGLALCKKISSLKKVNCAALLMVYVAPFSRGSITLSEDQEINIDFGILQDKRDMECLEKGLRYAISIANDTVYKDNCVQRWISPSEDLDSVDIKQYIKEDLETIHHYAGTCKMGASSDPTAVVNDRLKIHGIQNLRVVDASFFPNVPAGQICYPVIACAEKAADIILKDNEMNI